METDAVLYSPQDRLTFRRYARKKLKLFELEVDTSGTPTTVHEASLLDAKRYFTFAFQNSRPNGSQFRVYPAFVESQTSNAFAAESSGLHLCGVHIGLAEACHEFALYCFSQSALFPNIGDPGGEASPDCLDGVPPGFWIAQVGPQLDQEAIVARISTIRPKDVERQQAAALLTVLMLRYVWFHELCHCLNGHVGLAVKRNWATHLHEMGIASSNKADSRQIQCMEIDADQSAMSFLCQVQSTGLEGYGGFGELPLEFRLYLSIFAAYATTWIIDEHSRTVGDWQDTDHPDPYLRLHNLTRTVASNVWPETREVERAHDMCLEEAERLNQIVPSFLDAARIVADMRDVGFQSPLDDYQIDLSELRRQLDQFRYTN